MERSTTTPDEHIASLLDGMREGMATLDGEVSALMADLDLAVLREMVERARELSPPSG